MGFISNDSCDFCVNKINSTFMEKAKFHKLAFNNSYNNIHWLFRINSLQLLNSKDISDFYSAHYYWFWDIDSYDSILYQFKIEKEIKNPISRISNPRLQ